MSDKIQQQQNIDVKQQNNAKCQQLSQQNTCKQQHTNNQIDNHKVDHENTQIDQKQQHINKNTNYTQPVVENQQKQSKYKQQAKKQPNNEQQKKQMQKQKRKQYIKEKKKIIKQQQQKQQQKNQQKNAQIQKDYQQQQQMPDKFYDSDLASVNQKDFQSDNEPPKDIPRQRKLLHKQKQLHIYKTITKIGTCIDKPARFDQIKLRFLQHLQVKTQELQPAFSYDYLQKNDAQFIVYNLGKNYFQIQRLVTSMKEGEIALFQIQYLQVSKKSNIKVLKQKQVYVIEVQKWTTVIDLDGNQEILKYILRKGQGPYRVSQYDELTYNATIKYRNKQILSLSQKNIKLQKQVIDSMQPILWKTLTTMKKNQKVRVVLTDHNLKYVCAKMKINSNNGHIQKKVEENSQVIQQNQYSFQFYQKLRANIGQNQNKQVIKTQQNNQKQWEIKIQVIDLISIDDIFMDGSILKKLLVKGVSTAKPESSSLLYYALKFVDNEKNVLHQDPCFKSDWWEDFTKLDVLKCRKNYLDQYKVSQFLKSSLKRMKPGQISQLECRNKQLFKFGSDFQQLKKLWPQNQQFPPKKLTIVVRVYNFTEGKNCFNMDMQGKVQQSKRRKLVALKQLQQGNIEKACKSFQNIVSFYNSGDIDQKGYDQKISALMNAILCLMKQNKYCQMIPLCNIVLQPPKHGFNQDKMKIKATGIKVEGSVQNCQNLDTRENANLQQNVKIVDKCLYRKALALLKTGQSKLALQQLNKIQIQSEQVQLLKKQAQKHLEKYQQKSKKIYKGMFGP